VPDAPVPPRERPAGVGRGLHASLRT
jgi:hypothetical protein